MTAVLQFPLSVNVWHSTGSAVPVPPVGSPSIVTIGNLVYKNYYLIAGGNTAGILLVPKLTDLRGINNAAFPGNQDVVEVPAGSHRYYYVEYVDDLGKGFANEHRFAMVVQAGNVPVPLP